MTNYVKSTSFALKDSLPDSDPLKIVRGTEIDDEFNNIATAVATKADSNNAALTGVPTAPTAATSTETTQIATAAFVKAVMRSMYPVGSVYINAAVDTNPATLLGFGTWVTVGDGKVLVNQDTTDTAFDVLGETGGSKDAIVVSHTHTATVTDPGHTHTVATRREYRTVSGTADSGWVYESTTNTGSSTTGISVSNSTTGSSGTDANLQPYVVVRMWKRTA